MDFDHTYYSQEALQNPDYEWINLSDISSTKRLCEKSTLDAIYERISKRNNRGITFIGSGNYHYISYLLLSEITEPFTLLLLDHHTDMLNSPDQSIITCGSWIIPALETLPKLQQVIIIGVGKDWETSFPKKYRGKVSVLPYKQIIDNPSFIHRITSLIKTEAVYISIDKDVFNENEAVTDWDQGEMTLKQLDQLLFTIASTKNIIGEDICGEDPRTAIEFYNSEVKAISKKNEQANQHILKISLQSMNLM